MQRKPRISSAHLLAVVALFVALGGTAFAVKKNSVGTKQLKNSAVKEAKLAPGAVTNSKIAGNAVTGDKVDESTLGQVPSATTAGSANSAATASSATTADSAKSATDAQALNGRALLQVRSASDGAQNTVQQGLDNGTFESVVTLPMAITKGGADLTVQASVNLVNNSAAQTAAQCELRSDVSVISDRVDVTIPAGHLESVSLTGFADNLPETSLADPENVTAFCRGGIAPDDVRFEGGNLNVTRVPVAANV